MRPTLMLAVMVSSSAAPLAVVEGQQPTDELTPRAIADSTYAVRITVDDLLESIRRGQLDLRRFNDPQLAAAVGTLAAAGGKRSRRPPDADLGVLWDLQITLSDFQSVGREELQVRADVFLAAAPDSGRAPVTLTLRRQGDRWNLTAHERLVDRLIAIAKVLPNGWTYRFPITMLSDEGHSSFEEIGLVPDIWVRGSAEELAAGRDAPLDSALAVLRRALP